MRRLLFVPFFVLLLAACEDGNGGGSGSGSGGGGGDAGEAGCVPLSCEELGASCGYVHDGCGSVISCGSCAAGESCGAAGPNRCGTGPACTPRTCAQTGAECGMLDDGCAGVLDCGTCADGQSCGWGNRCSTCYPARCERTDCGAKDDGCGGTIDCGACPTPSSIRTIPLTQNALLADSTRARLYASVPSTQGAEGNSIAVIDPEAGAIERTFFVGSEPKALAISGDGRFLYVGLDGAGAVAQVDLEREEVVRTIALGSTALGTAIAMQILVSPDDAETIVVARGRSGSSWIDDLVAYDAGVAMPDTPGRGGDFFALHADEPVVYGISTFGDVDVIDLGSTGLTLRTKLSGVADRSVSGAFHDGSRLHLSNGRIVDVEQGTLLGTLQATGAFLHDAGAARSYFLPFSFSSWERSAIAVFDTTRFVRIDGVDLGTPPSSHTVLRDLVRVSANEVAFRSPETIYLLASDALAP